MLKVRARVSYWVARKLMGSRWAVQQPKLWRWMEGQFSRMAASGDTKAQSFYGKTGRGAFAAPGGRGR